MKPGVWIVSIVLVMTLALTGCISQVTASSTPAPSTSLSQAPITAAPAAQTGSLGAIEAAVESIFAQVNPSVVNIAVQLPAQGISPTLPFGHPTVTPTPVPQQFSSALGSGFVWDTTGNIVTNNHVVSGASRITVTFYDGTTVDATLVGADPDSDLAVIKVNVPANQLHPVTVADSSQLKVGQLAVAIGNPYGLQSTMTVGFVSGLGRLLPANENILGPTYNIPDIIQTDASINPGNSGGVLLDDAGNVIGVTAAIATTISGSSSGIGFAIPSAIVQQVVPVLIKTGHYDHPWLGVSIATLNPDLNKAMNLASDQRGALVETVTAGSPADKAGLRASQQQATISGIPVNVGGDVITAFNGQAVKSSDDLVTFLARSGSVGQTATLTVLRDGKQIQVQVTLAARPTS
jgi:S1-C subfamily serine protease